MAFVNILFILYIFITLSRNPSFCLDQPKKDPNHIHCTSDFNCTAHAYCHQSGICQCKDNYIPDREPNIPGKKAYHTVCLREATFIGDHCKKDIQCKSTFGVHSECHLIDSNNHLGTCQCTKEAHYINGLCYKTSLIGERCEVNDNCFTKSSNVQAYCKVGVCICPLMHRPTADLRDCQPASGLGGPCLDDTGCENSNSGCRYGFCRCKKNFVTGEMNDTCLLLAEKLEDPCIVHDQCSVSLQNSRCDQETGVCVCENDSHIVDGKCWKTVRFLEPCRYNNECLVEKGSKHGIACKEGLCQCRDGFVMEEQSFCLKVNSTETNTGHVLLPKVNVYSGLFFMIIIITLY